MFKSVYAIGFSVCPRSNSHKNSTNVLKLIYAIHTCYSINHIENGMYTTKGLSTETQKIIRHSTAYCGEIFKAYFNR